LLKSRKQGLLPNLSTALGTRFSINGNVLSGALRKGVSGANVDTNSAPAIASMIDYGDFAVEDIANPTWSAGMVGSSNLGRIAAFALAMAGHKPTPAAVARKAKDLLVYVGVGEDSASGRLRLNRLGMLTLDWPGGIGNEPVVAKLHAAMAQLAAAQGRQYVPNVFSIFNRLVTYHPLGGCPMADTAESGVVDAFGRVFNYPGLYVADGSIVPTALGRNPSYTIAALSERVAQQMTSDLF
jgi:cholesterol oxidase